MERHEIPPFETVLQKLIPTKQLDKNQKSHFKEDSNKSSPRDLFLKKKSIQLYITDPGVVWAQRISMNQILPRAGNRAA